MRIINWLLGKKIQTMKLFLFTTLLHKHSIYNIIASMSSLLFYNVKKNDRYLWISRCVTHRFLSKPLVITDWHILLVRNCISRSVSVNMHVGLTFWTFLSGQITHCSFMIYGEILRKHFDSRTQILNCVRFNIF